MVDLTHNHICYDYLTFTSKIHSERSIFELLGIDPTLFSPGKGRYGYKDSFQFDNINIYYNGCEDTVCCEMSGKGCRSFEEYGSGDYQSIFDEILLNHNDDSELSQMNITRLDVAYDDFIGLLDLPLLCSETQKHHFISRFKDWQVIFGNKGIAVDHGSMSSRVYIRIYDKRLEQKLADFIPHWVRCEIQMRKECAFGFIKNTMRIDDKYFSVLNNYLRYTVDTPSHKDEKADTAPHWLRFVGSAEKSSIFYKPKNDYNFSNLYSWVNNQLAPAIDTYLSCVGVDQFISDIKRSVKGRKINPKYQKLKEDYNRASDSGQGIIDYLKKNGDLHEEI